MALANRERTTSTERSHRPHRCDKGGATAGPDREDERGVANSFGTGGLPFYTAEARTLWSASKSLTVMLLGVGDIVLGLGESPGLVGFSCLIVLIGAAWLASAWRSDRAARRLERRARRHESIS